MLGKIPAGKLISFILCAFSLDVNIIGASFIFWLIWVPHSLGIIPGLQRCKGEKNRTVSLFEKNQGLLDIYIYIYIKLAADSDSLGGFFFFCA